MAEPELPPKVEVVVRVAEAAGEIVALPVRVLVEWVVGLLALVVLAAWSLLVWIAVQLAGGPRG